MVCREETCTREISGKDMHSCVMLNQKVKQAEEAKKQVTQKTW